MAKESRIKNKEIILERKRQYYIENKSIILDKIKKHGALPEVRAARREYLARTRKRAADVYRLYDLKRRKEDPAFKMVKRLRARTRQVLKTNHKSKAMLELIGCPKNILVEHLESMFLAGMSWGNHGEWHIDHIIPCVAFDLSDPEQQKLCFNFKNLQPLWAKDNLRKNARII